MPQLPKTLDSIPKRLPEALPRLVLNPISPTFEPTQWQKDMQGAFRRLESLLTYLGLNIEQAAERLLLEPNFPILVTQNFAERMVKGDWNDPLLLQILPIAKETQQIPGFRADAVGDLDAQIIPGLLHKYHSRALLMLSPHCAIHCRYCFRREFPYSEMPRGQADWNSVWDYLQKEDGIDEIIFSGGDPLFLDNRKLTDFFERALAIPAIKTIRVHTRLPIVLPSRIERGLLDLFSKVSARKTLIVVIHTNHAHEIDEKSAQGLAQIRTSGALLLNQTVLLKNVNDNAEALIQLSQKLIAHGVIPYYLHQLDRVSGTAHFEVSENRGQEIIAKMRKALPGYAVPQYVQEVAGKPHKMPIL